MGKFINTSQLLKKNNLQFALYDFLNEADDDEGADMSGDDNTADEGGDDNANDNADDTTEDNQDDADNNDAEDEEEPNEDDFDIDSGEAEADDGDDNTDDSTDTSSSSSGGDDEKPEIKPDSLKAKDKELFDTLDPEEQKLKNKKLKEMYLELYSNCNNIIDKFNSISIDADNVINQIKKVLNILFNLKIMISDYLLNIFDSKSYIENDIMLNRYLATFNSVKNITKEIRDIYKDEIDNVDDK